MAKFILAKVLKRKKISKRAFARAAQYDLGNLWKLFAKDYNPTLSTMHRCAKAIGCKVRELIEE